MTRARLHGHRGLAGRALVVGVALGMAPLAGCFSDATEVVVVVDTDLQPSEFGSLTFSVASSNFNAGFAGASFDPMTTALPATVGVVPEGAAKELNVTVVMWPPGVSQGGGGFAPPGTSRPGESGPTGPMPLTSRVASHVRFVAGQQLVLFLPLGRRCLCDGTSCPHALEPDCRELISPVLPTFDASHVPRLAPATAP